MGYPMFVIRLPEFMTTPDPIQAQVEVMDIDNINRNGRIYDKKAIRAQIERDYVSNHTLMRGTDAYRKICEMLDPNNKEDRELIRTLESHLGIPNENKES